MERKFMSSLNAQTFQTDGIELSQEHHLQWLMNNPKNEHNQARKSEKGQSIPDENLLNL